MGLRGIWERANLWSATKGLWAVSITLGTLYIGYQQNRIAEATVRPSLNIDITSGTPELRTRYGALSHAYRVENTGTTPAKNVSFSIVTSRGGQTLHEDRNDVIGDLSIKEDMAYAVHVHGEHGTEELIETLTISYVGQGGWWCDQTYTYKATYTYDARGDRWLHHPLLPATEVTECR